MWENNRDDWTTRTRSEWSSINHEQVTLLTLATDNWPRCSVEPDRYSWPTMARRVVNPCTYLYNGTVNRCGAYTTRRAKGELTFRACAAVNMHHACALACPADWKEQRRRARLLCAAVYRITLVTCLCSLRTAGARESPIYLEYTREAIYRPAGTVKRMNGNVLKVMLCDLLIFSSDMFTQCSSALGAKRKPLHDCNFSLSD